MVKTWDASSTWCDLNTGGYGTRRHPQKWYVDVAKFVCLVEARCSSFLSARSHFLSFCSFLEGKWRKTKQTCNEGTVDVGRGEVLEGVLIDHFLDSFAEFSSPLKNKARASSTWSELAKRFAFSQIFSSSIVEIVTWEVIFRSVSLVVIHPAQGVTYRCEIECFNFWCTSFFFSWAYSPLHSNRFVCIKQDSNENCATYLQAFQVLVKVWIHDVTHQFSKGMKSGVQIVV